jgi:hypothetical protein
MIITVAFFVIALIILVASLAETVNITLNI